MQRAEIPQTGAVVLDTARNRVGVVVSMREGMVHLDPGGEGETWTALPADVGAASPMDELCINVTEINWHARRAR